MFRSLTKTRFTRGAERKAETILRMQELEGKLPEIFMQIWLYTGYCSYWDGSNGEYTMIQVAGDPYQLAPSRASPPLR